MHEERAESVFNLSIGERLALQEQIINQEKKIEKLEADVMKEQQPRKKFDKFTELQHCKNQLENMKHGQA